jgi:hypothetical protein
MTMTAHFGFPAMIPSLLAGALGVALPATGASPHPAATIEDSTMNQHAKGAFDVKLEPQSLAIEDTADGAKRGRMSIDKQFHGDLEASSKGEMLSAMTDTKGSAGYVAIEKVEGSLHDRTGSFVLQHNATMTRGTPFLDIIVVPDSGTGELAGLSGTMKIDIAPDGKHSYSFDYTFAESR